MSLARAFAVHEARVWAGLALWLARRRDGVGDGVRALPYARAQASTMYALLFVCVVETVGMSFFTAAYPVLHWVVLALDVYTVLLVLGFHAGSVVRPHTAGPEGLRIRQGATLDLRIPAALIGAVRRDLRFPGSETPDGTLEVPMASQTSVTVELTGPVTVARLFRRPREVRTVRFHADEPHAAVEAIRGLMAAEPAR
ncbi:hypothetical protein IPZ58_22970 [Streptomyces roseoverticillatus]|uniref:hypothetical protein n=1 Tax=Streptomyces roseoverticillatus TaxID=66429 RepID=UPI001F21305F|nr:hypothetical protein [Streptomyces roseoverticillatus]MCF3104437.1 hypothetical protein [Streptomyces roseoverticillatus]